MLMLISQLTPPSLQSSMPYWPIVFVASHRVHQDYITMLLHQRLGNTPRIDNQDEHNRNRHSHEPRLQFVHKNGAVVPSVRHVHQAVVVEVVVIVVNEDEVHHDAWLVHDDGCSNFP